MSAAACCWHWRHLIRPSLIQHSHALDASAQWAIGDPGAGEIALALLHTQPMSLYQASCTGTQFAAGQAITIGRTPIIDWRSRCVDETTQTQLEPKPLDIFCRGKGGISALLRMLAWGYQHGPI